MKASDLIDRLRELIAAHGDLPVHVVDPEWCNDEAANSVGFFGDDNNPRFIVDVPDDSYITDKQVALAYRAEHIKQQEAVFAQMRVERIL